MNLYILLINIFINKMKKSNFKIQKESHFNNLILQCQLKSIHLAQPQKITILCFNNFIINTVEIIRIYVSNSEYKLFSECIISLFMKKYEKRSQCQHTLSVYMYSWKKYLEDSLQAKLFEIFLSDRQNKQTLKMYLKIRKEIIKSSTSNLLDKISLSHEQALSIIHRLYKQQKRRSISKNLNQFYINLNFKVTNHPKLQSCIFTQFLLYEMNKLEQNDQENLNRSISKTSSCFRDSNKLISTKNTIDNKKLTVQSSIKNLNYHHPDKQNQIFVDDSNLQCQQSDNVKDQITQTYQKNELIKQHQQIQNESDYNQKYNQNWSRVLCQNEKFKNRILSKNKQSKVVENNEKKLMEFLNKRSKQNSKLFNFNYNFREHQAMQNFSNQCQ